MTRQPPTPGQQVARRFRRLYVVALGLIAVLAVAGQVLVQVALSRQAGDSHVINQAGYQRMVSQRLTMKLLLFSPLAPDAQAQLDEIGHLRDGWVAAHQALLAGLPRSAYGDAARQTIEGLLHQAGRPMERMARLPARLAAEGALSASERAALLTDQEVFLPLMDSVVLGLERSAAARVAFLQRIELVLLLITLTVLALEAWLIFRPAVSRLRASLDELDRRNRQSARSLESLRDLSTGIAHNFNNLLTGMMGHAELERYEALRTGRSTEYIDAQLSCGRRAAAIVTQLTRYAGQIRYRLVPTDLGAWLRGTVPPAAPDHRNILISLETVDDAVAAIDRAALEPALHGVLDNAIEAMKGRPGAIRVRLRQILLTEARIMSGPYRAELAPGLYASIQIVDEGEGIDADQLDRIFDPFYSRRSLGRGLGLASVLGIVHGHGGGICVESSPGVGTSVSIFLPVANRADDRTPAKSPRRQTG